MSIKSADVNLKSGVKGLWGSLLVISLLVLSGCGASAGSVTLINKSSEVIESGSVKVCGQEFSISKMEREGNVRFDYTSCSEGYFNINLRFESGKKIAKEVGYLDGMTRTNNTIIVKPNYELDYKTVVIDE